MSTPFVAKYEFDTHKHKSYREPHTVICADASMGANGEGSVRFWIEKRHPETFDWHARWHTPAHVDEILGQTIYSYELVYDRDTREFTDDDKSWLLRELVLTLARGDVGVNSASSILWDILSFTAVRERAKWLIEGAPEWFALVDPERDLSK